jgi:hypothetical protein
MGGNARIERSFFERNAQGARRGEELAAARAGFGVSWSG